MLYSHRRLGAVWTCVVLIGAFSAEEISLPHQPQPYGDLFAVRLDGTGLIRLTGGPQYAYSCRAPNWTPPA